MNRTEQHYVGGDYWRKRTNESSDFKVSLALRAMSKAGIGLENGFSAAEIGCGTGPFLFPLCTALDSQLADFRLVGVDIATDAIETADSKAASTGEERLSFGVGSAADLEGHFDVIFLMDVVEHVRNPYDFLESLRTKCNFVVLHLPLEQSLAHRAMGKATESYRRYRHIHFFSLETALLMIEECGYKVDATQFTAASRENLRLKGNLALKAVRSVRFMSYKAAPKTSAALMGGSSMFVLSSAAESSPS